LNLEKKNESTSPREINKRGVFLFLSGGYPFHRAQRDKEQQEDTENKGIRK
jgi:hypothetical protein